MRPAYRVLLSCALLIALLLVVAPSAVAVVPARDIPLENQDLINAAKVPRQLAGDEAKAAILAQGDPYLHDGRVPDLVLTLFDWDPAHAGPHVVPFWKEFRGTHSDVYVGWNDLTPPPTSSQQSHTLTAAQIEYMGTEFDSRIWSSDVFHFGNYLPRIPKTLSAEEAAAFDGSRAAIMVYNIRDEAYWSSYRFYTAGYFWGGLNDELGINAIFIDSFDWANRIGATSARPHLYEGTIAHEFQHLIHSDVDGNEDSFVDEGCADLAEQFIYGTTTTASHIGEYLYYHRDSLIDWKGELFDYGNAVLWQDYLWENAGGGVLGLPLADRVVAGHDRFEDSSAKFTDSGDRYIWELVHDQANGLAGFANRYPGGMNTAEQLHRDYTMANLLDGKVTEPKWNYRNLTLGGVDSDGLSVEQGIAFYESNVNGNMPPTRKNVRRRTITEPWGAYYRTFGGAEPGFTLAFAGSATDGVSPYSAPYQWYTGLGNSLQLTLERTLTGVPASSQLSFKTWYDIEEDWDYGYVEASANGVDWVKLPQITTLHAGVTNAFGSSAWDGPGGFTGDSASWQTATFDLSSFTGTVHIRFRYATDEASNGQGWYVDDITAGAFSDAVADTNGWTTNGWLFTTGMQNNDWSVDAYVPYAKGSKQWYATPTVVPVTGQGVAGSVWLDTQYLKSGKVYSISSNRPRNGTFGSTGMLTVRKGK